jgi:ABC-type transport system involved in multi-copper enzyme maturation permease subunit
MFEPILRWETTRTVRRRRYFALRAVYAFALFWLLLSAYYQAHWQVAGSRAKLDWHGHFADHFFFAFSFAQLTAVFVLTPGYIAPALIALKSQRVLEQLLLTRIGPWRIVAGLWLGRCLCVVLIVLTGVPILAFAGLFGGIEYGQIALLTLLALACMFATAAISACTTTFARNARQAILYSYVAVGFLLALPWAWRGGVVLAVALMERLGLASLNFRAIERSVGQIPHEYLLFFEPYDTYWAVMSADRVIAEAGVQLVCLLCAQGLLTIAGLLFATRRLGRMVGGESTRQAARRRAIAASRVRRWRVVPLGDDPMLWKEWYFDHRPRGRWLAAAQPIWLAALASLPLALAAHSRLLAAWTPEEWTAAARVLSLGIFAVTLCQVAVRAATSVGAERDADCWFALMPTPLTAREIVRAKVVGAVKPLIWAVLLTGPSWVLAVYFGGISLWAVPGIMVVPLVFGFAIAVVGVWLSLCLSGTHRAVTATLSLLLFLGVGGHALLATPVLVGVTLTLAYSGFGISVAQTLMQLGSLAYLLYSTPVAPNQVEFSGEAVVVVAFCLVQLALLAGLAAVISSHCERRFAHWTGRTDGGNYRSLETTEVTGLARLSAGVKS